jgi:antirestriction protein ArdC
MREHRRDQSHRPTLYQEVTDRIIAELEQGAVPWVQPWGRAKAGLGLPRNAATGRRYAGINILILWGAVIEKGYPSQTWLTFRQALALGGAVRKGEHGTTICYADRFIPKKERARAAETGETPEAIPFLKRFTVFNVEQCDGLPETALGAPEPLPERQVIPREEALIAATGADFRIGGERAYYDVAGDFIRVPPQPAFFDQINFYRTALHELTHHSGHKSRLARDLSGAPGSPEGVGLRAARRLAARLGAERRRAHIYLPSGERHDFNDELMARLDAPARAEDESALPVA